MRVHFLVLVHEPLTCFFLPGVSITPFPKTSFLDQYLFGSGGDKRTRTADICLARAALYQLSYTPSCVLMSEPHVDITVVGYAGFEPATSPLSGVRSNQLS